MLCGRTVQKEIKSDSDSAIPVMFYVNIQIQIFLKTNIVVENHNH